MGVADPYMDVGKPDLIVKIVLRLDMMSYNHHQFSPPKFSQDHTRSQCFQDTCEATARSCKDAAWIGVAWQIMGFGSLAMSNLISCYINFE